MADPTQKVREEIHVLMREFLTGFDAAIEALKAARHDIARRLDELEGE